MNWLLLLVVLILVLFVLIGYKRGFIKMVVSVVSMLVTFVLALTFQPAVSNFLKDTPVYERLYQNTCENITRKLEEELSYEDLIGGAGDMRQLLGDRLEQLGIPSGITKKLLEQMQVEDWAEERFADLTRAIAVRITDFMLDMVTFILAFVIILIAVKIVVLALNLISYLPIIHGLNKLAGLALGGIEGVCVVWVLFAAVTVFASSEFSGQFFAMIHDSSFLSYLYENNVIMNVLFH